MLHSFSFLYFGSLFVVVPTMTSFKRISANFWPLYDWIKGSCCNSLVPLLLGQFANR